MTAVTESHGRRAMEPFVNEWGVQVQPVVVLNDKPVYALQPKQLQAYDLLPISPQWNGETRRVGYGGAAGGGKSHLARAVCASAGLQWPGSTGILFRRTMGEVEKNHVQKFREELPEGMARYVAGRKSRLEWCNGSVTYMGYLEQEKDIFRYQGPEYDYMIFEEATHYRFGWVSWLINNRLRATVRPSKPFALFPSNPGNVGHIWYRRWFIDGQYDPDEIPREYAFVQAFLDDNEVLKRRDPTYAQKLDQLAEPWRSWLRDGDFTSGAGQYFHKLSRRVHLVRPFTPPSHWPVFGGFDPGFNHPWVFGLYTADEDSTLYKLDTLRGRFHTDTEIIERIFEQLGSRDLDPTRANYVAAGLDAFHRRGREISYTGPTQAENFAERGIHLIEANTARIQGAKNLREYLDWESAEEAEDGIGRDPALYFCDTPGNHQTLSCLEAMVQDPDNPEDVLKVDADEHGRGGDDEYDETRYAVSSRPGRAKSVGMDRPVSAFDPEVLQHEAEQNRRVKDLPLRPRRRFDYPRGL